jgi:hypothetical protein
MEQVAGRKFFPRSKLRVSPGNAHSLGRNGDEVIGAAMIEHHQCREDFGGACSRSGFCSQMIFPVCAFISTAALASIFNSAAVLGRGKMTQAISNTSELIVGLTTCFIDENFF